MGMYDKVHDELVDKIIDALEDACWIVVPDPDTPYWHLMKLTNDIRVGDRVEAACENEVRITDAHIFTAKHFQETNMKVDENNMCVYCLDIIIADHLGEKYGYVYEHTPDPKTGRNDVYPVKQDL